MSYWIRAFKFALIGSTGALVNLSILYLLTEYGKFYYIISEGIAIVITFFWNYNGNILVGNIVNPKLGIHLNFSEPLFNLLRAMNRFFLPLIIRFGFFANHPIQIKRYGLKLWIRPFSLDWFIMKEIFEHEVYHVKVSEGTRVLDVGGHIGLFALYCAQRGAYVKSYEPESQNIRLFEMNLASNPTLSAHIMLERKAVWKRNNWRFWYPTRNEGNNSLIPYSHKINPQLIQCVRIDQEIQDCDLLKLDVEGAEYEIIEDLPSLPKQISIEYHTHGNLRGRVDALKERLRQDGFNSSTKDFGVNGYIYGIKTSSH